MEKKIEEWKKARAMMKAALTILMENYDETFVIGDVCIGLRDLIHHLNNCEKPLFESKSGGLKMKCKLNYPSDCPMILDGAVTKEDTRHCAGCEYVVED